MDRQTPQGLKWPRFKIQDSRFKMIMMMMMMMMMMMIDDDDDDPCN